MTTRVPPAQRKLRDLAIFATALSARLPFLAAGYGLDPDAWRVAESARRLARGEGYLPSRCPGYPVVEFANAWLVRWPAWTSNLVTAVFSAVAATLLVRHMRQLGMQRAEWTGVAFVFVPVVFVNSVVTLDYLWATMFILAAWSSAHGERWALAGLCLGVAMRCRLSSGVVGIALVMLAWNGDHRVLLRRTVVMAGVALATVIACYAPAYRSFGGLGFLTFVDARRSLVDIAFTASVGVWGIVGSLALLGVVAYVGLAFLRRKHALAPTVPRKTGRAAVMVIALEILVFLRLPSEAAYLIPVVPFALLLAHGVVSPLVHKLVVVAMVVSSFTFGLWANVTEVGSVQPTRLAVTFTAAGLPLLIDPLQGPVQVDHLRRLSSSRYVQAVIAQLPQLEADAVVICGTFLPELRVTLPAPLDRRLKELPTVAELDSYQRKHAPIYFLDGQDRYGTQHGRDLHGLGARKLAVAVR